MNNSENNLNEENIINDVENRISVESDSQEQILKDETFKPKNAILEKAVNFAKNNTKKLIIFGAVFALIIIIICACSKPKVISITASYEGDTNHGVVLSEKNKDIKIKGLNEKGKEVSVTGWKIEEPAVLEADGEQTVTIKYKELETKLTVECTSSVAVKISASYEDSLKEGTVVNNENIFVTAELKNGKEEDVSKDCTMSPKSVKLEKDGTYDINIEYIDPISSDVLSTKLSLECSTMSIESISAEYTGDTEAGTMLDEKNTGIKVTALLKNGTKKELSDWKVEKPVELKEDKTSVVKIKFDNYTYDLKVICSTMSESKYKEMCKTYSYDSLLRNPGKYKGKYIKLTGTVFQVASEASSVLYYSVYLVRVNGNLYRVNIDNYNSDSRILEDDTITVWGQVDEIYTYETIRGNSNTIPQMTAKYFK